MDWTEWKIFQSRFQVESSWNPVGNRQTTHGFWQFPEGVIGVPVIEFSHGLFGPSKGGLVVMLGGSLFRHGPVGRQQQ